MDCACRDENRAESFWLFRRIKDMERKYGNGN
jgi:hypothetical protein